MGKATVTKTDQLSRLPLWECGECGRLQFSNPVAGDDWGRDEEVAVGPDCPKCECTMDSIEKDSVTEFEAIGQHFHRDTGYVRPGKDCRLHSPENRKEMFDAWNRGTITWVPYRLTEAEAEEAWQQFITKHMEPSRLFQIALDLAKPTEREQKHLDTCGKCRSVIIVYRES
jgi:hypothetical protein